MEEFQRFLMALSERPGSTLAISAHRLPYNSKAFKISRSSCAEKGPLQMSGLRWLCHRSRHCLAILPGSWCAIAAHLFAPNSLTSAFRASSSFTVQGPFVMLGSSTFCHRCRHCTSLRSLSASDIAFQFFPSFALTAECKTESSSSDHFREPPRFLGVGASLMSSSSSKGDTVAEMVGVLAFSNKGALFVCAGFASISDRSESLKCCIS
mmetsp:Transcript_80467/g.160623  ORF Transcript_80467/g.160623 Transcript_80467/m.160623 type:complete len:209 (-) Transcript_80467:96-722(-)